MMDRLLDARETVAHIGVPAAFLDRDQPPAPKRLIPVRIAELPGFCLLSNCPRFDPAELDRWFGGRTDRRVKP